MENRKTKISVKGLVKTFGDLEVLKGMDVDVADGEVLSLIGPSGSGKSTFLRCINRLEKATAGTIMVDGTNVLAKETNINKLRENIGMVFQHFNLFPHLTVLQNVTLAPVQLKRMDKQEAEKRGMELLQKVGLEEKASAYPAQLSGGQKQRVAIARAMVTNPSLLLADEPTGNLDSQSAKDILDLINELHRSGASVLVITHDHEVSKRAERTVYIKDGEIVDAL